MAYGSVGVDGWAYGSSEGLGFGDGVDGWAYSGVDGVRIRWRMRSTETEIRSKRMESSGTLGVRKGAWSRDEDILLKKCIEKYGEGKWHLVPPRAGLNRCRKSCRWSLIAGRIPGRTANDVKNFWNTHIEKKLCTKEGSVEKEKVQKDITKSNIVRPQPRTFSKSNAMVTSPTNQTNDWTNKDEKHNNKKPSSSTILSSSQEEVDECIKWWSNLLEATELGEGTNPLPFSSEDHHIEQITPELFNNPVEQDGLSSLVLDVDCWELDSFHCQSFVPFN
ncbi:hypothetical protein BUALT_Bualt04G0091200 [Buddleja alternifolia]|uniref:Uncharacterized protein n=1 Tax=Buddleja alternifolia TaxID=168488 RepID=A0AAV6XMJ1_9LAMI|nr:hypothetical protein BUALT_Bualt04G0091200 [Buddleja alternifolia]